MGRRTRKRRILIAAFVTAGAAVAALLDPVGASASKQEDQPDFIVSCAFSHRSADDPIEDPGIPGASYSSDFFGNTTTAADSTYASLTAGGTTCAYPGDTAAYWTPTVLDNGKPVRAVQATIYYRDVYPDVTSIVSFPAGFEMIAGDDDATAAQPQRADFIGWACRKNTGSVPGRKGVWTAAVPQCTAPQTLAFRVRFPDCWNNTDPGIADQTAYLAYDKNGVCPKAYPTHLPRVSMTLSLKSQGGPGISLSSGSAFSGEAAFINSWNQDDLDGLVQTCLAAGVHCGHLGPSSP